MSFEMKPCLKSVVSILVLLTILIPGFALADRAILLADSDLDKEEQSFDKENKWSTSLQELFVRNGGISTHIVRHKDGLLQVLADKYGDSEIPVSHIVVNAHGNREAIYLGGELSGVEFAELILGLEESGVKFSPTLSIYFSSCLAGCDQPEFGFLHQFVETLSASMESEESGIQQVNVIGHIGVSTQNTLSGVSQIDQLFFKPRIAQSIARFQSFSGARSSDGFLAGKLRFVSNVIRRSIQDPQGRILYSILVSGFAYNAAQGVGGSGGEMMSAAALFLAFLVYQTVETSNRVVRQIRFDKKSKTKTIGLARDLLERSLPGKRCSRAIR